MTQRHDEPDRAAERGKGVQFTRLRNLCQKYSMTRPQNGTLMGRVYG